MVMAVIAALCVVEVQVEVCVRDVGIVVESVVEVVVFVVVLKASSTSSSNS